VIYFLYNIGNNVIIINNICISYTYITMEDGIEQHLSIIINMLIKQKIDEENRIKEATNETLQKENSKTENNKMIEHKKEKQD